MDGEEADKQSNPEVQESTTYHSAEDPRSSVNSLILDYYKKFGKKRDLEQFFSLSTAQSEVRDPTSLFWRRMKAQNESSESGHSGEKKSESSTELCRISIKCTLPDSDPFTSQDESKEKSDSHSPPIITEEIPVDEGQHLDNESVKSDDVQSQKSIDMTLDTSMNKPHSPTSSITSQRKLEWDSLADVGYGLESDRKTSASSLSTLERLALKQQYSNNDTQNTDVGQPTAHSTPVDANESKPRGKKGIQKKTTKIYKRDVDFVQLNVPHTSELNPQAINVNLTKHISFNVEKDGAVSVDNMKNSVSVSPEKSSMESEKYPQIKFDKEIQTSLTKNREKPVTSDSVKDKPMFGEKFPVIINLNTLRRKRKKRYRSIKRKLRSKKKNETSRDVTQEKSGDQLSDAESFEYMPGHMYHQNQIKSSEANLNTVHVAGNKSSLESSTGLTTDSSKGSKYSFSKDLEKSIELLKMALHQRYDDTKLKKKLIKDVVQRLIKSKYRDDDSTTDFLSVLSLSSKRAGLGDNTTTSSDNTTGEKAKSTRPRKSILRVDKFNSNVIASTSQSVPNLPTVSTSEIPISSNLGKPISRSTTDTESSNKVTATPESIIHKTSSEELYKKYLEALRREQAYKRHLKDKEMFLKQKLGSSDTAFKVITQRNTKSQNKLKDLVKDLIRNNYDDGSGDASKLEGGSIANIDVENVSLKKHRRHSVYTLSSNSDNQQKNAKLHNKLQDAMNLPQASCSKRDHHCCCSNRAPHAKVGVSDSSVQVNIKYNDINSSLDNKEIKQGHKIIVDKCAKCRKESPRNYPHTRSGSPKDDIKYVCLCTDKPITPQNIPDNFLICKCCRLGDKGSKIGSANSNTNSESPRCSSCTSSRDRDYNMNKHKNYNNDLDINEIHSTKSIPLAQSSKTSQTDINLGLMLKRKLSDDSVNLGSFDSKITSLRPQSQDSNSRDNVAERKNPNPNFYIHEATRFIQTEISINPIISDPSLTDINIINDNDCVKLICERYKEISTASSKKTIDSKVDNVVRKESVKTHDKEKKEDKKCPIHASIREKSYVPVTETNDKEIQYDTELDQHQHTNINNIQNTDHFMIPIEGTNMNLKVCLGCKPTPANENAMVTKGISTENQRVAEMATSLTEECSKGVQSTDMNIFSQFNNPKDECLYLRVMESIDQKIITDDKIDEKANKNCLINSGLSTERKYDTYPKNEQVNFKKPFLRSYTDTGNIENVTFLTNNKVSKSIEDAVQTNALLQKSKSTSTEQSISEEVKVCSFEKSKHSDPREGIVSTSEKLKPSQEVKVSASEKSKCSDSLNEISELPVERKKSNSDIEGYASDAKDPVLDMIQDITRRYSKKDIEKSKRKKCFKEIITVLNYLLDTEDSTDQDNKISCASTLKSISREEDLKNCKESPKKVVVDKSVQLSDKKPKSKTCTESSDLPVTTDFPTTSSESTCQVLNMIKKECEKYHQKRSKSSHTVKKTDTSSSTSTNCDKCKKSPNCHCRSHKCKGHKSKEKKKNCVAYNLIIQTSDSMLCEEPMQTSRSKELKNIIVKVPSRKKQGECAPFKEMSAKVDKDLHRCSPRCNHRNRSRSLPNESEVSSIDEFNKKTFTVREYLEKNRPDFVENCSQRQNCLKMISETRPAECNMGPPSLRMVVVHTPKCAGNMCACNTYCGGPPFNCNPCDPYLQRNQNEVHRVANERAANRTLLSLQLEQQPTLNTLTESELLRFAKQLGREMRRQKLAPKFISEREMKKHSEKIYKSLPEVVQKKEDMKKENIKKTNLLMANIFKKNLQKKTLRGAVNLSNYSTVIKI